MAGGLMSIRRNLLLVPAEGVLDAEANGLITNPRKGHDTDGTSTGKVYFVPITGSRTAGVGG